MVEQQVPHLSNVRHVHNQANQMNLNYQFEDISYDYYADVKHVPL